MKYRLATEEDREALTRFVQSKGLPIPDYGITFIATDERGEIVAMANGGLVPYVETIAGDDPMATLVCFQRLEGSLETSAVGPMITTVLNEEIGRLAERFGYRPAKLATYIKRR